LCDQLGLRVGVDWRGGGMVSPNHRDRVPMGVCEPQRHLRLDNERLRSSWSTFRHSR
jgi:hypothetical protein